jgi:hypothetical protein
MRQAEFRSRDHVAATKLRGLDTKSARQPMCANAIPFSVLCSTSLARASCSEMTSGREEKAGEG